MVEAASILILRRRRAKGLTQKQLAGRLKVSELTVIRWENDQAVPDESNRRALVRVLGETADDYATRSDGKKELDRSAVAKLAYAERRLRDVQAREAELAAKIDELLDAGEGELADALRELRELRRSKEEES